jgi:amino acid transporter
LTKEATEPKVFLRESTGLVKNVSALDAISLNLSNMSAGAALATIAFTMVAINTNGTNLVLASVFAFVLSVPQIIVYTMMTRRLPRSGGDYVWVSRSLGGFWGSSLAFMGYVLETLAFLALIALAAVEAVGSVALFFGYTSFTGIALPPTPTFISFGAIPWEQFAVAAVIFAALILVNIFKPKVGFKLVTVLAMFGVATLVIAIFTIIGYGHQGVVNYMNTLNLAAPSAGVTQNVTYTQVASLYHGSSFNFGNTIFLLPFFALFVYPWLNAAPAVGSEIKGKRAIGWNIPISSLVVFIIVTSAFGAMYYAGGLPFINSALSYGPLETFSFNFWTLAMGVSNVAALQWLIGIGWIVWNVSILAYGIIIFSRYIFAMSFDRFLPSSIANISRWGSPVVAHLFDLVVTLGLIGVAAFLYGSFQTLYAATVAAMIYFVAVGVSAVVYAVRKEKGNTKGILAVSGVLMCGVFLFIIYQYFSNPTIWGTSAIVDGIAGYWIAYLYAAASFVAGAIIYLHSKSSLAKKGIDISLAYKEIPPE